MKTPTTDPVGVLVVDKPEGMTSHDVVARVRRVLGTRKVGHAGTLDPMATGVLVLAVGRGTRLLPYLQATRKQYTATVRLGFATTTDDRTGDPLAAAVEVDVDAHSLDAVLSRFLGQQWQVPSTVSAVKVNGRRAYAVARAGEQVDLPARAVAIHSLRRVSPLQPAPAGGADFDVEVECSSGTYVRALARDIGSAVGCGAHLASLRRIAVGPFTAVQACPLPLVGDRPCLLPLSGAAAAVLPSIALTADEAVCASNGQRLATIDGAPAGPVALLDPDGGLVAVAVGEDGMWRYRAVFARG